MRCETTSPTLRGVPAYVQTSKSWWTTLPLIPKTAREWTWASPNRAFKTLMSSSTFKSHLLSALKPLD